MKLVYPKLLKENKTIILENMKMAKGYVSQGKLSEDDLKKLIEIDPTPQKKYVGWLSKIWINEKIVLIRCLNFLMKILLIKLI